MRAAVSSLLLAAAGLAALAAAEGATRAARTAVGFLALLFAFMAVDEWFGVHESLEDSAGSDWQTLYLGLGVVAAVAWGYALRLLRGIQRALWVGGAAAWAVAQGIERIQWDGEELVHGWTVLPEELLALRGALQPGLRDHVGDHQDQQR